MELLYSGSVQVRIDQVGRLIRAIRTTLPPIIMVARGLHTSDADHVLKTAPSETLFPLAVLLDVPIPASSIAVSPLNRYAVTFNRSIMNKIRSSPRFAAPGEYKELDQSFVKHGTKLPVVVVENETFHALVAGSKDEVRVWHARDGRRYLPVDSDERYILARRFVTRVVYDAIGYLDHSRVTRPPEVVIDGVPQCIMIDDSILLTNSPFK